MLLLKLTLQRASQMTVVELRSKTALAPMPNHQAVSRMDDHSRIILVTLVHGTFARGTAWTQEGSRLRRQIAEGIPDHAGEVVFDTFEWSGHNTHKARVKAGYELAAHIQQLRKSFPYTRHFIVAHSHGGNIALLAHKHLPLDWHALGVATLGTPFVYARLQDDMVGKSLDQLMDEAAQHSDNISGIFGWVVGIASAITADGLLENTSFDEFYWAIGSGVAAGLFASVLFSYLFPYVARAWHWLGGRRAAAKLANAVRFEPMPNTHVLSFIYPGDEARLLLDTLEITTALPSRAIRWIRSTASFGFGALFLGLIVFGFATAIAEEFMTFDRDAMGDWIAEWFAFIVTSTLIVWLVLVSARYVLSFLRGHPWGFGWERPSIHAHVEIGVEPSAELPATKSYLHEEVPYAASAARSGMRHVGLYEDPRILAALAYWMANVR